MKHISYPPNSTNRSVIRFRWLVVSVVMELWLLSYPRHRDMSLVDARSQRRQSYVDYWAVSVVWSVLEAHWKQEGSILGRIL